MSDYDYGPLQRYEITWAGSGHVEHVEAHQVSWPQNGRSMLMDLAFGGANAKVNVVRYVNFHGQFDGNWRLVLSAREDDIRTIRNVTAGESVPGGTS